MSVIEEQIGKIIAGGVSITVAGFIWLVRTVFTNNKKVDLLRQELETKRINDLEHYGQIRRSIIKVEKQNEVAIQNQQKLIDILFRNFERQESRLNGKTDSK